MTTYDEQYAEYKKQIDKWENFIGLCQSEPQRTELDFILNIRMAEIKRVPTVQLNEFSFMLFQYALFLQRKSNECQSFVNWGNYVHNKIKGDDITRLTSIMRKVETRLTNVSYLARRIEMMAQSLSNISRARYNEGRKE